MMRNHTTRSLNHFLRIGAPVGALALFASPTLAQSYEWEEDEGWHAEEWYDPGDWFDDEPYDDNVGIDYESHDNSYDAYWDGYYDGYYDDAYGYDHWDADWSANYESAYSDGYADGYYDSLYEYDYYPTYYVYSWVDPSEPTDENRAGDRNRAQGDRASDQSKASRSEKRDAAKKAMDQARIRGTVQRISQPARGEYEDHVVLRVAFEDGKTRTIDFGPKMTRQDMPMGKGDRVTIVGDTERRDDRKVVVAKKIVTGDETYRLRGDDDDS